MSEPAKRRTLDVNCPRCGGAFPAEVWSCDVEVRALDTGYGRSEQLMLGLEARVMIRAEHSC